MRLESIDYDFGPFRINPAERRLLRDGTVTPLTPKAFDLLVVLVESQGRLLNKAELIEMVWPGITVEEANLTQTIAMLRKALGESPAEPQYIETVPKHGYRFVATVNRPAVNQSGSVENQTGGDGRPTTRGRRGWFGVAGLVAVAGLVLSVSRPQPHRLPGSAEAYEALIRGQALVRQAGGTLRVKDSQKDLEMASQMFARAIEYDPNLADGFGWLALTQYEQFRHGDADRSSLEAAVANANRALQLDKRNSVARRALIHIFHSTGQTEAGLHQARLALDANPNDKDALEAAAMAYFRAGLVDKAIPQFLAAVGRDHLDRGTRAELARSYLYSGDYQKGIDTVMPMLVQYKGGEWVATLLYMELGQWEEAIAMGKRYLALSPETILSWLDLGRAYAGAGQTVMARQTWMEGASRMEGKLKIVDNPRDRAFLAIMYAHLGSREPALDHLRRAVASNPSDPWTLFHAAEVHAALGDKRDAVDLLKGAVDHGFLGIHYLDHDSRPTGRLYGLRDDPEFRNLRATLAGKIEELRKRY